MKLGRDTGSLTNYLMSGTKGQPVPVVGMGATVLMWTDRYAVTIVEVSKSGRRIKVQEDDAIRMDSNGMSESQSYKFLPNPNGPTSWYSLRKDGGYVAVGSSSNGRRLRIGERDAYRDYGF